MWDFEHPPRRAQLARRYSLDFMLPAQCAASLELPSDAPGAADIGLVPVAALATTPGLRVIPGCTIAARTRVRSILLVRRAATQLQHIRSVAADTSSRASITYARILFCQWWNPEARFLDHAPDLDAMLSTADAAILIGDPALFALEDRKAREQRTGEKLIYHDLAAEWIALTGLPWVSAVWAVRESALVRTGVTLDQLEQDFNLSRDHGLEHLDEIVDEWSARMPLPADTIRTYLTTNIHYLLDDDCLDGLKRFFQLAESNHLLPAYALDQPANA
jgi:chorismate dehydratase